MINTMITDIKTKIFLIKRGLILKIGIDAVYELDKNMIKLSCRVATYGSAQYTNKNISCSSSSCIQLTAYIITFQFYLLIALEASGSYNWLYTYKSMH